MQQATIYAVMADGTMLTEFVQGFWAFIDMVLEFRRDPDCIHLSWAVGDRRTCYSDAGDLAACVRDQRLYERDMAGFAREEARSYGLAVA